MRRSTPAVDCAITPCASDNTAVMSRAGVWGVPMATHEPNGESDTSGKGVDTRLSFILPIARSGTGRDENDLLRARLLLATLDHFFDKSDLAQIIVISPGRDLASVQQAVAPFKDSLNVDVIDENEICPELAANPDTRNKWPRENTGWFRQQLIKLAMHEHVSTPFYMTLDSDVLFVRSFRAATLINDQRALTGTLAESDFRSLFRPEVVEHELAVRIARTRQAERVLALRRPDNYAQRWYSETPVLLNRAIAAGLSRQIEDTWQMPWRSALLGKLPWTEYSLYFLYAESSGLLEQNHAVREGDCVLRLRQSLWQTEDKCLPPRNLANLDLGSIFEAEAEGVAIVIQSYLGYPVRDIAAVLEPYLGNVLPATG